MFYIIIDKPWDKATQEATEYVHPFDEYAPLLTDIRYAKGIADYSNARRIREELAENYDKPIKVIERNK